MLCQGPVPLSPEEELAQELELLREEELQAQRELEECDRILMRADFWEFTQQAMEHVVAEPFEPAWHHEAFCRNLQGLYTEYKKRRKDKSYVMKWQKLIQNAAPATVKSRITMVLFPAWVWLDDPTFTWGCLSVNPKNVKRDSEDCRAFIGSPWYRQTFKVTWHVKDNIDSKGKFQLSTGGERISTGLLADHVGMHVNGILVDDPDDAFGVHSEAERLERQGKMETLASRFADKRCCIWVVTQQRVHVDDCTGELLSRGGWEHANYALDYSAKTRHDTPWFTDPRTIEGDVLQPERFTVEVRTALRTELGEFGYEAQGNGNPQSMSAGMLPLPNWRFCRIEGQQSQGAPRPVGSYVGEAKLVERNSQTGWLKLDWLDISVDATFGSMKETASHVGLLAIGGLGPDCYCLDDRTAPRDYVRTKADLCQMIKDWQPHFSSLRILVEKKANGDAIIAELTDEFPGLVGLDVEGGKESRAYAMSPAVDSGHMYVLDGAAWMPRHLGIVSIFPHGKRDDEVDAWSQCTAYHREPTDAMKILAKNAAFKQLAHARTLMMARGMR